MKLNIRNGYTSKSAFNTQMRFLYWLMLLELSENPDENDYQPVKFKESRLTL